MKLHTLVKEKGFNDCSVVKLSQELDVYNVEWQQLLQSNVRETKRKQSRMKAKKTSIKQPPS